MDRAANLREEDTRDSRARIEHLQQLLRDAASYVPDDEADGQSALHGWLARIA